MRNTGIVFMLMALASCGVYLPQTGDIPLINRKKDLHVDIGWGSAIGAGAATVSYGLTDKIAVQAYGAIGSEKRYMYQGAVGYYKNLPHRKVREIYVGFGSGYGDTGPPSELFPFQIKGDYQIYYTQLNYGKLGGQISKWDLGVGAKLGLLHIKGTEFDYVNVSPYNVNHILLEPTLMARVGGENLKFAMKLGFLLSGQISGIPMTVGIALNFSN